MLPPTALRTFQRVALLGLTFSTDELLAISDSSEDETYGQLELALAALVVEPAEGGFRFRHPLVRERLVEQAAAARAVTRAPACGGGAGRTGAAPGTGGPPLPCGRPRLACRAVRRSGPWRSPEHSGPSGMRWAWSTAYAITPVPEHLPVLLARRGDLLMALGDPAAVEAYTEAARVTTGTQHRLVRARLARAAAVGGDLATARSALAGLDLEDDEADTSMLLAQGNLAYFAGDMETARRVATEARDRLRGVDDPWHLVDLVGLHGLLAHQRGEWFASFRTELRRTQGHERLAGAALRRPPVRSREPALRPRAVLRDHRRGRAAPAARQPGRSATGGGLRHRPDR